LENSSVHNRYTGLSKLTLFLALSRTPHGLLDMAAPAFGALLWLGAFPSMYITILGLITVFAGYTAVYALNDIIDYRVDKEKVNLAGGMRPAGNDLDAAIVRHPMAQGLLSYRAGLFWAIGWSTIAVIGAYLLNPICVLIFIAGCALETVYCLMLRISPFRTIVSGGVKTTGVIAAVYAVDPAPSLNYVICLFLLFFFWEIGGQNIPNDWADIEEDCRLKTQTVPVCYGANAASLATFFMLILALLAQIPLIYFSKTGFDPLLVITAVAVGGYLFLPRALQLYRTKAHAHAMSLFNRASYYPLAMLSVVLVKVII